MLPIQITSHASALGRWTFSECHAAALGGMIESIWEVQGTVTHARERIFPNARIDLIVNLGAQQRLITEDGHERLDAACISGFQLRPLVIESTPDAHVFGVRFRVDGARLLTAGVGRLGGRIVRCRDALDRAAWSLTERLAGAASFEQRVRLVLRWAEERSVRARALEPHVGWIASRIEATGGQAVIGDLRRATRISSKKLAEDFHAHVGAPPKLYARVVRFRRALAILQHPNPSLAGAAMAAGYYDQPHMNLDFRELAGLTPREFLAARYPDGNSAVAP